jgi:hypothetical protein
MKMSCSDDGILFIELDIKPIIKFRDHQGVDPLTEYFVIARDKADKHIEQYKARLERTDGDS